MKEIKPDFDAYVPEDRAGTPVTWFNEAAQITPEQIENLKIIDDDATHCRCINKDEEKQSG